MGALTLSELSGKMKDIDFSMLLTHTEGGRIAGRPMSNNGEVDYTGDSYFFSHGDTRAIADIGNDPKVSLSFHGKDGPGGRPGIFIAVEGEAELLRDRALFAERWVKDLERWFEGGIDTPGLVLIKVAATRVHYWDGEDEGELVL